MKNTYHSSPHLIFNCKYHVIFCPKFRRKILTNGMGARLKQIFSEIAEKHCFSILEMEVMPDHVQLLVDCNPRYGIMQCVTDLKRESAIRIYSDYPVLRKQLPSLWTRSRFVATVGAVSLDVVKKYIEDQKVHEESKNSKLCIDA